MKPVYKCDYCDFMGIEEDVLKHEPTCVDNYDRKSCFTCSNREMKGFRFKCTCGIEIPEGKIYEFCGKYDRKEKTEHELCDIFSGMFGGI